MNLARFTSERDPLWRELDALMGESRGRAQRLGPERLLRLGDLYRAAAADLAFARRRWPNDPVVTRLDHLVNRARIIVYGAPPKHSGVRAFFARDYWQRIVERPGLLALAIALLVVPMLLTALWAAADPVSGLNFAPDEFEAILEEDTPGRDQGLTTGEEAAFSSMLFTNNIRVTFLAFAGGMLLGVGSAWILGFNGMVLGSITGLAFQAGNGSVFTELVVGHGILELSCIVVTGAAGLRLGWAIVAPGNRRRADVVMDEGRRGVEIVLGTMPWLVLAGLVEGFGRSAGLGLAINSVIGLGLGALFWGLAFRLGRAGAGEESRSDAVQSRAIAFARR